MRIHLHFTIYIIVTCVFNTLFLLSDIHFFVYTGHLAFTASIVGIALHILISIFYISCIIALYTPTNTEDHIDAVPFPLDDGGTFSQGDTDTRSRTHLLRQFVLEVCRNNGIPVVYGIAIAIKCVGVIVTIHYGNETGASNSTLMLGR